MTAPAFQAPTYVAGVSRPGNICGDGTFLLTTFPLGKKDLLLSSGFRHSEVCPSVSLHSGLPGPHFTTCRDSSCPSEHKVITQGDAHQIHGKIFTGGFIPPNF